MPRVMVERFAKDHLGADEVIRTELIVNGLGFVTGLEQIHAPVHLNRREEQLELQPPKPVIFHDGRFVKRLTPTMILPMK
ncbi:unnamed protein product [Thlaspi arvense]|uniref:Glycerol-3-phosphate acyltransferase RAM2/GPAT1-8 HAD-like domain-containing protein n=1 Tax=Thlaspi arvense TaxID=13288 RepID=A0AAU9RZY2_THLAR|nr:unnamed protein product [Thlaspi arvense]